MFHFSIRDVLWPGVMVLGCLLMAVGSAAAIIGASIFASTTPVPPLWEMIGGLCFVGFWIPGLAGLALFFAGLVRIVKRPSNT